MRTAFSFIFFERVMRSKPRAARLAEQAFRCAALRSAGGSKETLLNQCFLSIAYFYESNKVNYRLHR